MTCEKKHELCSCGREVLRSVYKSDGTKHTYKVCGKCANEESNRFSAKRKEDVKNILRLQVLRVELHTYFDSRYLGHWQKHFSLFRTKKEIWEVLNKHKIIDYGLSAFYEKVKRCSLKEYLKEIACISAMGKILNVLEIYDPYLIDEVDKVVAMAGNEYIYLVTSRD